MLGFLGASIMDSRSAADDVEEDLVIPGLPNDLALLCLSKISHGYHGLLRAVSKRWQRVLLSPQYFNCQSREGRCGDWLFVLTEEPRDGRWTAYDPAAGKWHWLPATPGVSAQRRHYGFVAVGVASKLLVIGGHYAACDPPMQPIKFFATKEVMVFDPFSSQWSQAAPMRVARCNFACAVIGQKVYVAGGCNSHRRNPLADAEVYDPATDSWKDIPPLPAGREDCVGVALNGLFYVIAGFVENEHDQRTVDVYDPVKAEWYPMRDVWVFSRQMPCPVTSMKGCMYALDDWDGNTIKLYNPESKVWVSLAPLPSLDVAAGRRPKGFNFGLIGLGDELYVLGGKLLTLNPSPYPWKRLDVVRLNSVMACRPSSSAEGGGGGGGGGVAWRRVESMGLARGQVLGCAVLEEADMRHSVTV